MSNGTYNQFSDLIAFYDRKRKECPKGVTLKLHDNRLLFLQFIDPTTGKRTSRSCSVQFTEKGVLEAIDKAYKVSEALKRYSTSSEFWDWYNTEIIGKNTIKNDLLTYKEIFKKIEDDYFRGKNRNTGRQRERDVNKPGGVSDWSSFNAQYGSYFNKFTNWDNYPTWEEMKELWFTKEQGSKTFLTFKTVLLAIAELTPNNTKLIKQIKSVNATQTKYREKQSISLDDFLNWYKDQINSLESIDREDFRNSKRSWLWVCSMCVLYGLRPSEVTAIKNLTESYTKDGVTIYPLTDIKNNPDCTIIIGEFTFFGTSTKTGLRVINPVPLKHLWDELKIRNPLLPEYKPKEGSKPDSIASGFDNKFYKHLLSYKCPITQKYSFRHLYNQLLEMCGVNTSVRSRLMGHSETTNQGTYKKRRNLKTELDIINSVNKKTPLTYDLVKQRLIDNGLDINDKTIKRVLDVVYQLNS
jgi:integrase